MTVSELIASYKTAIETEFGFNLEIIQTQKALCKGPLEKLQAFSQLEQEIISTINSQLLNEWLIANSIPENDWDDYSYFDGKVLHNNVEVTLE